MAPTRLPRDAVITWGLRSEVYDAVWADHGSATAITRLTIAESPALAQAQAAVADGLGRGMTMDLCANAVHEVVKAWPIAVTSEGYAVLASASGVRMRGTVRRVPRSPLIPDDVVVERVGI